MLFARPALSRFNLRSSVRSSVSVKMTLSTAAGAGAGATLVGPVGLVANDGKTGAKGEPMTPIPSATLVILCPIGSRASASSAASRYATLVVQRSARAGGSFRSAVVFPGGLLDKADEYAIATAQARPNDDVTSAVDTSTGLLSHTPEMYLDALRLCALRETFEETGLLLLPANDAAGTSFSRAVGPSEAGMTTDEWTALRKTVHDDARAFPALLKRISNAGSSSSSNDKDESSLPPLAPLRHHTNWVTPRTLVRPAKRFDTHFFLTVLDKPDALGPYSASDAAVKSTMAAGLTADGSESTDLRLSTPSELMSLAIRDEIILFPPQYYILADVHTTLSGATTMTKEDVRFAPLLFGQEETQEEDNHACSDIRPPPRLEDVSSVEPQGRPTEGLMIPRSQLRATGGKHGGGKDEVDEEDQVFVLPLVLPGDALRPLKGDADAQCKRNRVYVTPRSRGEGGGMMVHGVVRRGQRGLNDFTFGTIPGTDNGQAAAAKL